MVVSPILSLLFVEFVLQTISTHYKFHNLILSKYLFFNRVLTDSQTKLGAEYILSAFPFENDKVRALNILNTVSPEFFSTDFPPFNVIWDHLKF